jgi:hypothetical protein
MGYLTKCGGFAYTVSQGGIGEERGGDRGLCAIAQIFSKKYKNPILN